MKKTLLSLGLLASLIMVGCSHDDVQPANGQEEGGTQTNYLSVRLVNSDNASTRASQDGYEDGTTTENKVTKIRFYFFTESGVAANVKMNPETNSYVNYYDYIPKEGEQQDDTDGSNTIESVVNAILVIDTKDGDKLPQRMVAIINPTNESGSVRDLNILRGLNEDYAHQLYTGEGAFVMSNSVYATNTTPRSTVTATVITKNNLASSIELAKANPVKIYVERNVAKVKVKIEDQVGFQDGCLALKDKNGDDLTVENEQVYLKLKGWSLTAETDRGNLIKRINPDWEGTWWMGTYRSCWALNHSEAENKYVNYDNISKSIDDFKYTNENAEDLDPVNPLKRTKVILKGELVKKNADGTFSPFTIYRHMGGYFADTYSETESENLKGLKKSILSQFSVNGFKYYYDDNNVRKQLSEGDIKIVIASQVQSEGSKNNCYVYAQLTEDAKAKTWYTSTDQDAQPLADAANTINTNLANKTNVDRPLVWKQGMTYYYYEIKHGDEIGVVRNHIYDTRITKISGLGTPVYDPSQTIYPEKPDNQEHYIYADIKILAWHVVKDNYELKW